MDSLSICHLNAKSVTNTTDAEAKNVKLKFDSYMSALALFFHFSAPKSQNVIFCGDDINECQMFVLFVWTTLSR